MTALTNQARLAAAAEIDVTLSAARDALDLYAANPTVSDPLSDCAERLRAVLGVTRVLDVRDAALLAEEMSLVVRQLLTAEASARPDHAAIDAVMRGLARLPETLRKRLSDSPDGALDLLPLLNDLRAARRAALLSETALPVADSRSAAHSTASAHSSAGASVAALARRLRPRFQVALVGLDRGERVEQHLRTLSNIAGELQTQATERTLHRLWSVVGVVIESLVAGSLELTPSIHRLLNQAETELKRLVEVGEADYVLTPPTELLTQLLQYLTLAGQPDPQADAVRPSFDGEVESGFGHPPVRGDRDEPMAVDRLVGSVAVALKADLASVQDALDRYVRFSSMSPTELQPKLDLLKKIGDTLGVLGFGDLCDSVLEQCSKLTALLRTADPSRDTELLEVASAMILLGSRVEVALGTSGTSTPASAPSQVFSGVTEAHAALFRECLVELSRVKEMLSASVADRSIGHPLAAEDLLKGMAAALCVVGHERGATVLQKFKRALSALARTDTDRSESTLDQIADAMVAFELYLTECQAGGQSDAALDVAVARIDRLLDRAVVARVPEVPPEPMAIAVPSVSVAPMDDSAEVTSLDIAAVFRAEARDIVEELNRVLAWIASPGDRETLSQLRRGFHTLKGSGRMVGALPLGEFAWTAENLLNRLLDGTRVPSAAVLDALQQAVVLLPMFIARLEQSDQSVPEADECQRRLEALASGQHVEAWPDESDGVESVASPMIEVIDASPAASASLSADVPTSDSELAGIYQREMLAHLAEIDGCLAAFDQSTAPWMVTEAFSRACHTLAGTARMTGSGAAGMLAEPMDQWIQTLRVQGLSVPPDGLPLLKTMVMALRSVVLGERHADDAVTWGGWLSQLATLQALAEYPLSESVGMPVVSEVQVAAPAPVVEEAADIDIRQVFSEEAAELLETGERALGVLAQAPGSAAAVIDLQRVLHTLKGSARMAGVLQMSDLAHDMESLLLRVEAASGLGDAGFRSLLQTCFDELNLMRDAFRDGRAVLARRDLAASLAAFRPVVPTPPETPVSADLSEVSETELVSRPSASGDGAGRDERRDLARVDAGLLNRLLNGAGEVSIGRSRLEQQLSSVEFNLTELARVVQRMKSHLRKLELESEAQIANRDSTSQARAGFDPLELDRFTGLQHAARALSESAADIGSLQGLLEAQVREGQSLLIQQARTITELQTGLMRARMVPFERFVPRLARTLRQVALETGRKAELVVTGADGELDRQVLERLLPPFEHMVRNAIVHGIEPPEQRLRCGKADTGRVEVSVRRDGAETFIVISDDGAGMDLRAIRDKAIAGGFIDPRQSLSDQEAMQLTLEPGFSTASHITAAAGRGVGMDVVVTEIKRLGGELQIATTAGVGTSFTVRLPFTLAVAQALIVRTGEELYALALPTIEAVVRISRDDVARHLAEGVPTYRRDGQTYRFQYLGSFIGSGAVDLSNHEPIVNVLLIRAGAYSTAIVADELIGNREIVVKNVGPQVSAIRGISGATVLGDGRVVLILDLPTLVRSDSRLRTPAELIDDRIDRRVTVLVVDDSITVRRVTQRLLERHGMRVLLAKDGVEARKMLETQTPDVMLLDIEMPRMDGYEVAAQVRAIDRLKQLPIVMITSRVGDKHRARAIELGVNDYLSKPYQEHQLLDAIEPFVRRGQEPT